MLYHRTSYQQQTLIPIGKLIEWLVSATVQTQKLQPLCCYIFLYIRVFAVQTDAVIKPGDDDVTQTGTNAVFALQSGRYVADILFDLPNRFSAAALMSEDKNVVNVALWMIAGDQ